MQASKSFFPLLTAILLAADISGCSTKEHQDPRNLPDLVRIATVEPPRQGDRSFTGVVTARVQSDLGFRVPGKVTKRLVDVGQNVRAGQPLMRIDVTDYAHAITTQTQNVEAARVKAEQARFPHPRTTRSKLLPMRQKSLKPPSSGRAQSRLLHWLQSLPSFR